MVTNMTEMLNMNIHSKQKPRTVPLHHLYNGVHFYTVNTTEIGSHLRWGQTGKYGYKYIGVACIYKLSLHGGCANDGLDNIIVNTCSPS